MTVAPGASTRFEVVATSTGALTYQWLKDGHLLSSETNATLNLVAVGFSDVGLYRVVVQDPAGMVNSRSVRLKTDPFGSSLVAWGAELGTASLLPPSDLHDAVQVGVGYSHVTVLREDSTVMVWGYASDPVLEVPAGLSNVVSIAAGGRHSLALKADGKVVAWGVTADGRTDVPSGLSNVVDIAAGYEFSAALKADGRVVVWGSDYWGQRRVPTALTNAVSIAASSSANHTVALRADGTVLSWGFHWYGATNVPSGLESVVAIAAGGDFGLALKSDDTLAGWGNNDDGQRTFPAGLSNSVSIVGGSDHALALSDAGQLTAWGYKFATVTNVPPIGDPVVSYSAGRNFTVALHSIEPAAFVDQPLGATLQVGDDVVLSATAAGMGPLAFRWYRDGVLLPGETNSVLSLTAVATNAAGSYTVSVSNVVNTVVSAPAVVTVNRLSQSVDFGALPAMATTNGILQLSAVASSGLPVEFQSADDAVAVVSGNELSVRGSGAVTITASQPGNETYLPSPPVSHVLNVYEPLTLLAAPQSQVVLVGADATFGVNLSGSGPIRYQWFFKPSVGVSEVGIQDATNQTLTIAGLVTNQSGLYSVEVENPLGSLRSPAGVLTVERLSQTITFSPLADRLTTDGNFTLGGHSSSGLPVEYLSSEPSVASVNGAVVSIHGSGTTVITARQMGNASYSPAVEVSRELRVNEPVAIVSSPQNQTVLVGSNVVFSVGVSGSGPFSYQWRYRASDGEPWDTLSGETNMSLALLNVVTNASGIYAVWVTGPANSETAQASLTVNRRAQTIFFDEIPVQSSEAGPRSLAATASSGLPVDYVSANSTVATVEGASLRIVGPGDTTITASQAGDSTYLPAEAVTRTLTVLAPVSVVTSPASQTVAVGSNVLFSVEAAGGGELGYAWSFLPEGQATYVNLPGETNATLRLDSVTTNMAGFYAVIFYNQVSSKGVGGRLTVLEPVTIMQGPTNQVAAVGSNVVFGVEAVGGGELAYQWSVRPAEDTSFVDLIGETNATLTLTNVTTNVSGSYSVLVSNSVSSNRVSGELTVLAPVSIVASPASQTVAVGSNVLFSVAASGGGELFYSWGFLPLGQSYYVDLPGETNATLRLDNVTTNMAGFYAVNVYNQVSGEGVGGRLTVLEPVTILQGPTNQVAAVGSNVVFGVEAVGGGELAYQWSVRSEEGAPYFDLVGETNATLTLTNVSKNVSGSYSVQVSNPVSSNIVSGELTVIEPVSIVTSPVTQTVVVGSNVVFSVAASGGGELFYSWGFLPVGQSYYVNLPGETNATLRLDNVTTNMAGFYAVIVYNEVSSEGVGGRLTVNRRPQSIEFDIPAVRLNTDGPSWLGGKSDSGLLVSYSSSNPSVARIEDDVLIIVGVGSTTITARQPGNAVYLPADSVPRPLMVLRRVSIGEHANTGRDVKLQGFRLLVGGNPNREVVIEYKDSLSDTKWAPLKTNMVGQADVEFIDQGSTNRNRRFYRVIER